LGCGQHPRHSGDESVAWDDRRNRIRALLDRIRPFHVVDGRPRAARPHHETGAALRRDGLAVHEVPRDVDGIAARATTDSPPPGPNSMSISPSAMWA
jgi:hypothetical protein